MIGKLKGLLDETGDGYVIVDVQGIGYVVYVTRRVFASLPQVGQAITLFIETQMREDAIRLFGFSSRHEQEWFRLLQNVQGVGAKVALAVLGTLGPDELTSAIARRDTAMVAQAPGVGKKVAERIVTELRGKAPAYAGAGAAGAHRVLPDDTWPAAVADAISALCNLGYARELAAQAVATARQEAGENADSARLIRFGLKELAR